MVLNCVVSPRDRGFMLQHAWEHLRPGGALVLGLPRRCVLASAYTSAGRWLAMLRCCGFQLLHVRQTPKLLFFTLGRLEVSQHLAAIKPAHGDSLPGWPWLAASSKDYESEPVLSSAFEYNQSDMVVDNLVPLIAATPPATTQVAPVGASGTVSSTPSSPAGTSPSATVGVLVPAWLRSGIKEASKLLSEQPFTVQRAFRDPLICLTPHRKASKGGDKANFAVSLLAPGELSAAAAAGAGGGSSRSTVK
jgi:hypothetical protein